MSASIDDVNKSHGLCMYTLESTNTDTEDLSVNKLRNDVTESLNTEKSVAPSSKPSYDKCDFEKEDSAISPSCSSSTSLPVSIAIICSDGRLVAISTPQFVVF